MVCKVEFAGEEFIMSNDCVRGFSTDKNSVLEICDAEHGGFVVKKTDIDTGELVGKQQIFLSGDSAECTYCRAKDGPKCKMVCELRTKGLIFNDRVSEAKEKLIAKKK